MAKSHRASLAPLMISFSSVDTAVVKNADALIESPERFLDNSQSDLSHNRATRTTDRCVSLCQVVINLSNLLTDSVPRRNLRFKVQHSWVAQSLKSAPHLPLELNWL